MATKERRAKKKVKVVKKKATRKKARKRKPHPRETVMERDEQMVALRAEGYTLEDIGQEFGLTRQRVHQLVSGGAAPPKKRPKGNHRKGPDVDLLRGRGIEKKIDQYEAADSDAVSAEVGDRIVYCRLRRGMTIGQLAYESGVPYGVLSTYENNKAQPSCANLRKLCMALRVSAHWIIFGHNFKRVSA